jgi:hypothetical protein
MKNIKEEIKKLEYKISSKKAADSTLQQVAEAVKGHELMSMRKPLEKVFKKRDIDFTFEPHPSFHIKHKGKTIIIVSKNNVEKVDSSDVVVGNYVIGYL